MTIRIRYKITLLFTGIIVALVLYTYFQIGRIIRANFSRYATQEINRTADVVDGYVKDILRRNRQSIRAFANIAELNEALRTTNLMESDSIFRIPFILAKYRPGYDFDSIRLYDPSGAVLGDAGYGFGSSSSGHDWPGDGGFSGVIVEGDSVFFASSAATPTGGCIISGRTLVDDRFAAQVKNTTGVHVILYSGSNLAGSSLESNARVSIPINSEALGLAAKGVRSTESLEGKALTLLYTPLRNQEDRPAGAMVLAVSSEVLTRIQKESQSALILIIAAGAFVTLIVGFLFAGQISVPLNRLMEWAHRIAKGDLDYRTKIKSHDEIRELAQVFDAMTSSLKESFATIRSQNEELLGANEKLKELDRLKTDFLVTVSHELKTPLTSILGFAQINKKKMETVLAGVADSPDPKLVRAARQQDDNLSIILSESARLSGLIANVMDLTGIEAGRVAWKLEDLPATEVLETGIARFADAAAAKGLSIERDFVSPSAVFRGDRARLVQVMENLLSNAVKFTETGRITCRLESTGKKVVISVSDTGPGIPSAELPRIFDKFRQVGDVLTDKPQGLGLGLAVCKGIVEGLGGTITAESEVGKGSRFSFTVPAGNDAA